MTVKEFVEKTAEILEKLITDMKSKKEIVTNMDEIMTLDMMESKRRLNKNRSNSVSWKRIVLRLRLRAVLKTGIYSEE